MLSPLMLRLALLLCCSAACFGVVAAETEPARSIRRLMESDGRVFVAAAFPKNHEPYEKSLTALWAKIPSSSLRLDRFEQPWGPIGFAPLEQTLGPVQQSFVVVSVVVDRKSVSNACGPTGGCTPLVQEVRTQYSRATSAYLFNWSCTGIVIPVLQLEAWPWKRETEWPLAVAVSTSTAGTWTASLLSPLETKKIVAAVHPLVSRGVVAIKVSAQEDQDSFVVLYDVDATGADLFYLLNERQASVSATRASSPMDHRC